MPKAKSYISVNPNSDPFWGQVADNLNGEKGLLTATIQEEDGKFYAGNFNASHQVVVGIPEAFATITS